MFGTAVTSAVSYIGTNIDDIFILMLLFAQACGRAENRKIILGHYLGIGLLTGISIGGAVLAHALPEELIGLSGLVPIALGVRAWLSCRKNPGTEEDHPTGEIGVLSVTLLTAANGADNIGVYIPLFSGYSPAETAAAVLIFAVMTGLWCLLGYHLAGLTGVRTLIRRYQHIIVPAVLIGLGVYILLSWYV